MSNKNLSHFPDGNSHVVYHTQLDRLVIANSNGVVKIINLEDNESLPISIDSLVNLTSVALYGKELAITTTEGILELIDLDKNVSRGSKYRSELALRDVAYVNLGNRILCGGDDNKLIIIDLQQHQQHQHQHQQPEDNGGDPNSNKDGKVTSVDLPDQLLNIAHDSAGELSSISLSNGSVEVYSVYNEKLNLIHTLHNVIPKKINTSMEEVDYADEHREELYTTKTQWSLDGKYLLVPGLNNEINVYNRESWDRAKSFKSDGRIVDFSLQGNHLAILTLNDYKVYNFITGKTIKEDDFEFNYEGLPLNIEWRNKTDLLIGSTHGDVLVLRSAIPNNENGTQGVAQLFVDDMEDDDDDHDDDDDIDDDDGELGNKKRAKMAATQANGYSTNNNVDGDGDGDDVGNNQNEIDELLSKAEARQNNHHKRLRERNSKTNGKVHGFDGDNNNNNDDDDDDGNKFDDDFDDSILDNENDYRPVTEGYVNGYKKRRSGTPTYDQQQQKQHRVGFYEAASKIVPYSPGSTPFLNKGETVDRRYLAMNNVGYAWIVVNKELGTSNSITVSFFDRSLNSEYHFTVDQNFDLASLNHKCILLGDSSKGLVYYKSHNDAGSSDAWERVIPLVKDEYITSICVTNHPNFNTIVVGTNVGYLRFFNQFGVCLNIIKTNPVVALSAASTTSNIFMVNQNAANVYSYSIIDIDQDNKFIQHNGVIPIKDRANRQLIKGLFFNEYNDPCIVGGADNTLLILQAWREPGNARWVPLINCHNVITEYGSNENKKNWSCWPLGLVNDSLNCLILKNGQFPGFPLPLPVEIEIEIPTKLSHDEDSAEEEFLRSLTLGKLLNDTLTNRDEDDQDPGKEEEEDALMDKLNQYSLLFDKSLLKMFGEACKELKLNKAFSIAKLIKNDKALLAASKISERMEYLSLAAKIGQLREQLLIELDSD